MPAFLAAENDQVLWQLVSFCETKKFFRSAILIVLIVMLALCAPQIFGQKSGQESKESSADWILYEQANAMFMQREFGKALQLYKEAISYAGVFPEAEIGIGDVFFEEGEFHLAISQYEKAYTLRNALRIADSKYMILYKLADLYQSKDMYSQMEDALLKIEADDQKFSGTDSSRLKTQIWKNYTTKGLDHALFLYQFEVPFAQQAHSRLGWFYYRSGLYEHAAQELLFAVIYNSMGMNESLHDRNVDYQFSTLSGMISAIQNSKEISNFAATAGFPKDLYYLAGASYAAGYPERAVQLWKLVSESKIEGTYSLLAARQLKSPWVEKVLGPGRSNKN
jgi:hypothetical protein